MSSDDARADAPDRSIEETTSADRDDLREGGQAGKGPRGGLLSPKNAFLVTLSVSIAAFVVAVVFGVLWWTAVASDESDTAQAREQVIEASAQAIKAYTEFDHTEPDLFRDSQMAVSTKEMQNQIEQSWPGLREAIVNNKRSASTRIFDIAVDELNVHEGKAAVIASLEVEVKGGEDTASKRIRIQTQMERVEDSWKLPGIDQVPVIPSGS